MVNESKKGNGIFHCVHAASSGIKTGAAAWTAPVYNVCLLDYAQDSILFAISFRNKTLKTVRMNGWMKNNWVKNANGKL